MNKGKKLYEGKAKIIYSTNDKYLVIQHFKDDATAFNNLKKSKIEGKGVLNNRISEYLLSSLAQCGIKNRLACLDIGLCHELLHQLLRRGHAGHGPAARARHIGSASRFFQGILKASSRYPSTKVAK